jgi:hypothetical protein
MLRIQACAWLLAAVAVGWLAPQQAHAGIGACGNINVEAEAMCTVIPPGAQCEAMCTPVSVRAACRVRVAADCRAGCDHLPSVDCSGKCEASCTADCEVDPGKFDCQGACEADCSGRCSGECKGKSDQASCEASCEGSCSASCKGHCDVEPPMADCEASCKASCEGSCEVDPNLDCQIDCQADAQADCEAEVKGGCEVECQSQEGALFCDGEYIDHGGKLEECIAALKAALNIKVHAEASGESGCTEGEGCMASGRAAAKVNSDCSAAAPGGHRRSAPGVLLAAGWVLALGVRRRKTSRSVRRG